MNTVFEANGKYRLRLESAVERLYGFSSRRELSITAGVLLAYTAVLLLILLLPGRTYLGQYAHDFMVFVDGANRILDGQVPNGDFHTPLGPLAFLLPAYGWSLGGSLGAMMPIATAIFAILFVPLLIYVAGSRLPLGWALAFGLFIMLLVVVPLNPGEPPDRTAFAMFYNRFCWALLSTLFLMLLPGKPAVSRPALDAVVIAALLLLMFYLKISYAAIGLAFVAGLALLSGTRRAAVLGLVMTAVGAVLVELFWFHTGGYLADIGSAAAASGTVRGSIFTTARIILDNFSDYVLVVGLLLAALLRGVRFEYLLYALGMAIAGLLLINQNAQNTEIITLLPAALVAILAPGRDGVRGDRDWRGFVGALAFAALILPAGAMNIASLGYQAVKAAQGPGDGPFDEQLDGVVTLEGGLRDIQPGAGVLRDVYRTGSADLETVNMLRHARYRQPVGQTEYIRSLQEAVDILRSEPKLVGKVYTLDMTNPLNALAGRTAPKGVDAWNHVGRTFSADHHRAPEAMFADVEVVMVPKLPVELPTFQLLRQLYGSYVEENYELVTESTYWRAYRRRNG